MVFQFCVQLHPFIRKAFGTGDHETNSRQCRTSSNITELTLERLTLGALHADTGSPVLEVVSGWVHITDGSAVCSHLGIRTTDDNLRRLDILSSVMIHHGQGTMIS